MNDLIAIYYYIISKMLTKIETGKTIRRQVRNSHQKLIVKVFHIKEIITEG